MTKRIYLAGPDVFERHASRIFADLMALCEVNGLIGVPPTDGGMKSSPDLSGKKMAQRIRDENVALIRDCDAVLANFTSFRGLEPDSGTVFEAAFAHALGKPVAGYYIDGEEDYFTRVADHCDYDRIGPMQVAYDNKYNFMIEEFGCSHNLMLACSFPIKTSSRAAIEHLAEVLRNL